MNYIITFINRLKEWGHAFLGLFFFFIIAGIFSLGNIWFASAFCVSLAYWFREVTQAQYAGVGQIKSWWIGNWPKRFDRIQTVILIAVMGALAVFMTIKGGLNG